jgi:hypothetical protein
MTLTHKFSWAFGLGLVLMASTAVAQTTSYGQPAYYTPQPQPNTYLISSPTPIQGGASASLGDTAQTGAAATTAPATSNYFRSGAGCDVAGGCDASGVGCGAGCDGAGGCGGLAGCGGLGGLGGGIFGGILKRSDHCFSDFISPITNPVFFEDPRNLTEARFVYLHHKVPLTAAGGTVQLYALQLRARLGENVSVIATKDGYITSTNPLIDDGWADLSAGLKVNLLRDPVQGSLLSAGVMYEFANGSLRSLQGNGDGEFNLFVSGGKRLGRRGHWIGTAGWRVPADDNLQSTSVYFSNHIDVQVTQRWYALMEFNWYHWTQSGVAGLPGVEGLDLFNLGSTGVTGNDIVTGAAGTKFKASQNSEIGIAWEFPLTDRRDIIENRFTFDWIFRY